MTEKASNKTSDSFGESLRIISKYASKAGFLEGALWGLHHRTSCVLDQIESEFGPIGGNIKAEINSLREAFNNIAETI